MREWILAWRSLARRPGFAAAAVLILALGIGANTATFSMVDAVLLRPLPYPNPDRLVTVYEASPAEKQNESLIAPARLEEWSRMNRTFAAMAASYSDTVTDTSGAEPERLSGRRVSPRYFAVFGARPLLGRTLRPEEDEFGGPVSVVISSGFWKRRYNRAPDVLGRRLILAGKSATIVGVMPPEFSSASVDVWIPAQLEPSVMAMREARFYAGVGRLKAGVSIGEAQRDLTRVQRELGEKFPATDARWAALVGDLKEARVGDYRKTLMFIFGAVGLLLLIAVANIAGLMLTQFHRRERELAIRSSIGATRTQVVAGLMREVLLIAGAGVMLGCAVAAWAVDILTRVFPALPHSADFRVDWRAALFASSMGILSALLCGILPAFQATRGNLAALLSQAGRGGSGSRHRWQSTLVTAQIALTMLLLSAAALMLRSYHNLSHVDLGFEPSHAITFHMAAAWDEDRTRVGQLQEALVAKIEQFPGVKAVGFANFLPISGATLRYQVTLDGVGHNDHGERITVGQRSITRDYLKSMGASLVAGQPCPDLRTVSTSSPKALVSRRFVEMYGEGQNLVGRHFHFTDQPAQHAPNRDSRRRGCNARRYPKPHAGSICLQLHRTGQLAGP